MKRNSTPWPLAVRALSPAATMPEAPMFLSPEDVQEIEKAILKNKKPIEGRIIAGLIGEES